MAYFPFRGWPIFVGLVEEADQEEEGFVTATNETASEAGHLEAEAEQEVPKPAPVLRLLLYLPLPCHPSQTS